MGTIRSLLHSHRWPLGVLVLVWGFYFIILFSRIVWQAPDALYSGHEYVWADWSLHIGMANIFALKSPSEWFAYHPVYAGGKFTYPFLTNLISGLLMRVGLPLTVSFILPSILFMLVLIFGMYILAFRLLKSPWRAVLAVSLFFLSAGMGFVDFFKELGTNFSWDAFLSPRIHYSRMEEYQWYAGNAAVGFLVPQRAFLLGMTVGVWVLVAVLHALESVASSRSVRRGLLFAAGVGAGLLPIIHMHTFIVLVVMAVIMCFAYPRQARLWLWYALPAGFISAILFFLFVYGGIENAAFFSWFPGWTARGLLDWFSLWLQAWGLMIPAAVLGCVLLRPRMSHAGRGLFAGAAAVFILGNLFLFQPTWFDNTKLFLWAYLIFAIAAAELIGFFWSQRHILGRGMAIILVFTLCATGVLELTRLQRIDKHKYAISLRADMEMGEFIRSHTLSTARFLTDTHPTNAVMIWGVRPILMGYPGWVWTYGFLYQQRERDISSMYQGEEQGENLLRSYEVSYVVIGPSERANRNPNEAFFASNFPLLFSNTLYRIYDTRSLIL